MTSNKPHELRTVEHFVTLFDNNFLPMGLCLHQSLLDHGQPFHLWILCMDELVEQHLQQLALSQVSLISLRDVENDRLLAVKPERTRGEYCWTLTPFTSQFVFDRDASVNRVTYLDADLFFFDSPKPFFDELDRSGKHVLITEHAYDPRYDKSRRSGRFCVQFMTFRKTIEAEKVMRWWQERCLEWCYARVEDGKFGDQKYLDKWPELFEAEVHILAQKDKTLAPWNVRYYAHLKGGHIAPVFYHFHGLRLVSPDRLLLYSGYQIGEAANRLYDEYIKHLHNSIRTLKANGILVPLLPLRGDFIGRLLRWKRKFFAGEAYAIGTWAEHIL